MNRIKRMCQFPYSQYNSTSHTFLFLCTHTAPHRCCMSKCVFSFRTFTAHNTQHNWGGWGSVFFSFLFFSFFYFPTKCVAVQVGGGDSFSFSFLFFFYFPTKCVAVQVGGGDSFSFSFIFFLFSYEMCCRASCEGWRPLCCLRAAQTCTLWAACACCCTSSRPPLR